jgi:lysophospholipid acyltransferase (LPLAT)-like uncharacterized protein
MRLRTFFRHPWVIRTLAFFGALAVRCWIGTLRYQYRPLGPNVDPHRAELKQRVIYAFWHENLLLLAYQYGRPDIHVLISEHADGQLITEIAERLGFRSVRGSRTRGGRKAMLEMIRIAAEAHIAITPDGPKGPRRQVQPGLVYLAAKTGLPIVPIGIGFDRPWRARSWDCFALPRPFRRARTVTGELIHVPADADKEALEAYRQRVEQSMLEVGAIAEHWAESGTLPRSEERKAA